MPIEVGFPEPVSLKPVSAPQVRIPSHTEHQKRKKKKTYNSKLTFPFLGGASASFFHVVKASGDVSSV